MIWIPVPAFRRIFLAGGPNKPADRMLRDYAPMETLVP